MTKPVLDIEAELFLSSLDGFKRYYMPLYNKERVISGLAIVSDEDTIINMFLDMRAEKYGLNDDSK